MDNDETVSAPEGVKLNRLWPYKMPTLNWADELVRACRQGDRNLALLAIKNGARDWDAGLNGACWTGHYDMAKLMFENGARVRDWHRIGAEQSGNARLVELVTRPDFIRK